MLKRLNELGEDDVLVADNLKKSDKYRNLVGAKFRDYVDKDDLLPYLQSGKLGKVRAILHQGACTDTLEYDGKYMMANNFEYSKELLHYALEKAIPFVYASSAAVYGHAELATENSGSEAPLNIYGYSKYLFDVYVRRVMPSANSTIVGLRYFNVYGPGEAHKGKMSSMVFQLFNQVTDTGTARLFGAFGSYAPGEQTRDFIYVKDIVELNVFFWQGDVKQAVVNAGTGVSRTWNDLARSVISSLGKGSVEYIDFPRSLADKYQFNTRADVALLRSSGYTKKLRSLEEGVSDYVGMLRHERECQGGVGGRPS